MSNTSLQDAAYAWLSNKLVAGDLWPGELLNIDILAEESGTSSVPMRDAVRRLAAEQAIVIEPQRGTWVRLHSVEEFAEITRLRCHLERIAIGDGIRSMPSERQAAVAAIFDDLIHATKTSTPDECLEINRRALFSIFVEANLPTTLLIIEMLWRRVGPLLGYYSKSSEFSPSVERILELKDAVLSRDPQRGGDVRVEEISAVSRAIVRQYETLILAVGERNASRSVLLRKRTGTKRRAIVSEQANK